MRIPNRTRVAFVLFLSISISAAIARADKVVATVTAGTQPGYGSSLGGLQSIAVNVATNKVYVANYGSANVTVIDGSNNAASTIPAGTNPAGIAVNPVTNRVYVTNQTDGTVTAIDGATDTVIGTITVGTSPEAIAVNPVTNKVYVANHGSANITVIDAAGDANSTATVPSTATNPLAIAVNPVTNKIYVGNEFGSASRLTVIDGATNTATGVGSGGNMAAVVVNPATNMIYLADYGVARVFVVNGADNTFASYSNGASPPMAMAVNPVTNRIYTANISNGTADVLDGSVIYSSFNPPPTVVTDAWSIAVAVNPVTNKIYVVNYNAGDVTVIDGESNYPINVPVGTGPNAVAINPVTNKIYVANTVSGTVSVIDGVTDAGGYAVDEPRARVHVSVPIVAGTTPNDIAINPVTNKVYVANQGSDNVTVIDGSTTVPIGATLYLTAPTTTVGAGSQPTALAVDPFRNMTYVANKGDSTISMIDALNNSAPLNTGTGPGAVAVNPVTNMIYVANTVENTVSIVDGATGSLALKLPAGTHPAGGGPKEIAVDPAANKVFIANYDSNDVTIIDGNNHYTKATVAVGTQPIALAVNPNTGKVYVANYGSNNATIIDTANLNATTTVVAGTQPMAVTIDPSANKAYVGSQFAPYRVAMIDGVTNAVQSVTSPGLITAMAANPAFHRIVATAASTSHNITSFDTESVNYEAALGVGTMQMAIAADPFTNKIYLASSDLDPSPSVPSNVAEIDQTPPPTLADPLTVAISEFANNTTQSATPSFTFTVSSAFAPVATVPNQLYYQVDGLQPLLRATPGVPGTFTGTAPALAPGPHIVYAFATDGQEASAGSLFVGALAKYMFLVLPAGTVPDAPVIGVATSAPYQAYVSFAPPANDGGAPIVSYTATSTPDGITATGTASPIVMQGLTNGTSYTFTVTARNAIGTSAPSAPSNSVQPMPPDPTPGTPPLAPTGVTAAATTATSVSIDWSVTANTSGYWVLRSSSILSGYVIIGTASAPPAIDSGVSANTTYLYKVVGTNSWGHSLDSPIDVATTVMFTDASLTNVAAATVHINELRTAMNAMLAAAGLPAHAFTDPALVAGTTPIKAVHVTELRSALDQARAALSLPPLSYTDPTITPGTTTLKAAHLEELRAGTQ